MAASGGSRGVLDAHRHPQVWLLIAIFRWHYEGSRIPKSINADFLTQASGRTERGDRECFTREVEVPENPVINSPADPEVEMAEKLVRVEVAHSGEGTTLLSPNVNHPVGNQETTDAAVTNGNSFSSGEDVPVGKIIVHGEQGEYLMDASKWPDLSSPAGEQEDLMDNLSSVSVEAIS
ncbi:hypothetical protein C2845_PM03G13550 [Panicum miliaceum]|uniref:Uncharacterized protein n=1 Tax=Panicum miliaceum TaxID=4540 RepID=A0A3L6TCR5_PANMI|nr:hypothetical protein C2845_PM03G13550 [Panicum miliaceum]